VKIQEGEKQEVEKSKRGEKRKREIIKRGR
jgi:hypothetical protein